MSFVLLLSFILIGLISGITIMAVVGARRSSQYHNLEIEARRRARNGDRVFREIFDQMYGARNW